MYLILRKNNEEYCHERDEYKCCFTSSVEVAKRALPQHGVLVYRLNAPLITRINLTYEEFTDEVKPVKEGDV